MQIPVISIVGLSGSGKTTLIEKLIGQLSERGLRVGTIKHDVHGFEIDHPGKDSWRHTKAGSLTAAISSPAKVAVIETVSNELTLSEIIFRHFCDLDIILTEGYKQEAFTKIEIIRKEVSEKLLSTPEQILLVATDSDKQFEGLTTIDLNDAAKIADHIVTFIRDESRPRIDLFVGGKKIPLNRIMQTMMAETITGLITPLKGVKNPEDIQIRIRKDSP